MENIRVLRFSTCETSDYIKPAKMHFIQNGIEKTWDLLRVHDSVASILFNTSRQVLIFVKQFRPAVFFSYLSLLELDQEIDMEKYPAKNGITIELCAGIVDKNKSLAEITQEEIFEECGYKVPLENIEKVTSYRSGVGVTGSVQNLFYTEVTDEMKVNSGGGCALEGEMIDIVEMTLEEANQMITDETISKPISLMFALMWFFNIKKISLKPKL